MSKSHRYRNEIMAQKWGRLTVLEFAGYTVKHRRTLWKCRCDCGKEVVVRSDCLRSRSVSGRSNSCGCGRPQFLAERSPVWKGHKEIAGGRWAKIKHDAAKRKMPFKITIKYAWGLFLAQSRKCAITGLSIEFPERAKGIGTASLDRIDSAKGYVPGNVWWVHKRINWMKSDLSMKEFMEFCALAVKNCKFTG